MQLLKGIAKLFGFGKEPVAKKPAQVLAQAPVRLPVSSSNLVEKRESKPISSVKITSPVAKRIYAIKLFREHIQPLKEQGLTHVQIADVLNEKGLVTAYGNPFDRISISDISRRVQGYIDKENAQQTAKKGCTPQTGGLRIHVQKQHEKQQALYELILPLYNQGMMQKDIAEYLNERGYRTTKGKLFKDSNVGHIIQREGKRQTARELTPETETNTEPATTGFSAKQQELIELYRARKQKLGVPYLSQVLGYELYKLLQRSKTFASWTDLVLAAGDTPFKQLDGKQQIETAKEIKKILGEKNLNDHGEPIQQPRENSMSSIEQQQEVTPAVTQPEYTEAEQALVDAYKERKAQLGVPFLTQTTGYRLFKRVQSVKAFPNWSDLVRAAGDTPYSERSKEERELSKKQIKDALLARGLDSHGNRIPAITPEIATQSEAECPAATNADFKQPVPVVEPVSEEPVTAPKSINPWDPQASVKEYHVKEYLKLKEKVGHQPTTTEAGTVYHRMRAAHIKWEEIVELAGDVPFNKQQVKTVDELVKELDALATELGYMPYPKDQNPKAGQLYRDVKRNNLVTWDDLVAKVRVYRKQTESAKQILGTSAGDNPDLHAAKRKLIEDYIKLELKLGRTPTINDASVIFQQVNAMRFWQSWDNFKCDVQRHKKQELIQLLVASKTVTGIWPVPTPGGHRAWDRRTISPSVALPLPEKFIEIWGSVDAAVMNATQYCKKIA